MTAAIASPLLGSTSTTTNAKATGSEKLSSVAKQFESIFIRQMLAEARKTSFGESMLGGQGMDTFRQMQDDRFADIASDTGAFGLGKMIEAHLARTVGSQDATAATDPATGTATGTTTGTAATATTTKQEASSDGI